VWVMESADEPRNMAARRTTAMLPKLGS
jgi:hypothetical protein